MKKGTTAVVSALLGAAAGAAAGGMAGATSGAKETRTKSEALRKMQVLYLAFDRWMQMRQDGRTLAEYFEKQNYKTVAIYGMKELGERLVDELKNTDISVRYAIDRNADSLYADVDLYTPDDELEPVDVVVVTAIYYFDEIEEAMRDKVDCPIISLEDILYEM